VRFPEIAKSLAAGIRRGDYLVGEPLPSIAALAAEFDASASAVQRALEEVERLGLATRTAGRWQVPGGTHSQFYDFTEPMAGWAVRAGLRPTGQTIEAGIGRATSAEARALGILDADRVARVVRVVTLEGRAALVVRATFIEALADAVLAAPPDITSLLDFVLDSERVSTGRVMHRLGAISANSQDVALLGVRRGAPLTHVVRTAYDAAGRAIEHTTFRMLPGAIDIRISTVEAARTRVAS